jgi:hypothetical protein
MTSVKAPPSMYSITTQRSVRRRYDSKKLTMFGCRDSFITRISFTISSFLGCCVRSICLIATFCPSESFLATKTCPDALFYSSDTWSQDNSMLHLPLTHFSYRTVQCLGIILANHATQLVHDLSFGHGANTSLSCRRRRLGFVSSLQRGSGSRCSC